MHIYTQLLIIFPWRLLFTAANQRRYSFVLTVVNMAGGTSNQLKFRTRTRTSRSSRLVCFSAIPEQVLFLEVTGYQGRRFEIKNGELGCFSIDMS
jgi:hypothetical protein